MTAYLVLQIAIIDQEQWGRYREAVMPLISQFGGRPVTGAAERLEGDDDGRRIVLFEFASMAAIHAFWDAPDYVPVKALRRAAAKLDAWAVPGR